MWIALPEPRAEQLILNYRRFLAFGFGVGLVAYGVSGVGLDSAIMAVWLGANAGALQGWRTQPGLWMLSTVLGAMTFGTYATLQYFALAEFLQQRNQPWPVALDMGLSTYLLWLHARLLITVSQLNRRLSQSD